MNDYAELLESPEWKARRAEILERDGHRCTHCNASRKVLQVHHRNGYVWGRKPWDYADEDLQTLCIDCHQMLKGQVHGNVQLLENGGFSYDGTCPECRSTNIKEKGSFDKCLDCGERISYMAPDDAD